MKAWNVILPNFLNSTWDPVIKTRKYVVNKPSEQQRKTQGPPPNLAGIMCIQGSPEAHFDKEIIRASSPVKVFQRGSIVMCCSICKWMYSSRSCGTVNLVHEYACSSDNSANVRFIGGTNGSDSRSP